MIQEYLKYLRFIDTQATKGIGLSLNEYWPENKIIESKEGVDILISRVDLINIRIMGAQSDPEWKELKIINGVHSVEEEE